MFNCPLCAFSIRDLEAEEVLIQVIEHFKIMHPKPVFEPVKTASKVPRPKTPKNI